MCGHLAEFGCLMTYHVVWCPKNLGPLVPQKTKSIWVTVANLVALGQTVYVGVPKIWKRWGPAPLLDGYGAWLPPNNTPFPMG